MNNPDKKKIEQEWAKYKYSIMEKSYKSYKIVSSNICQFNYNEFIGMINLILAKEDDKNQIINTLYHVWGYFKKVTTAKEKAHFFNLLDLFKEEEQDLSQIKSVLYKYALKYNTSYLLNSYYFINDKE